MRGSKAVRWPAEGLLLNSVVAVVNSVGCYDAENTRKFNALSVKIFAARS